jgi:glyoxalase-like protein
MQSLQGEERINNGPVILDNFNTTLAKVDHLVYGTPVLEKGVAELEKRFGFSASTGGKHLGRGTHNALISLGPTCYLEIIAPDPDQPSPAHPRLFGIDQLKENRLLTWAAKSSNLNALAEAARTAGIGLGEVIAGSRLRPDGVTLSWRYTSPLAMIADGLVPFFIDWGDSKHPAEALPPALSLIRLRAEHPDPSHLSSNLMKLDMPLEVVHAQCPSLIATIKGPMGEIELR